MKISEVQLCNDLIEKLIALSADWEEENSTYGYRKNNRDDIEGRRIFLAEKDNRILGYLLGTEAKSERASSIMADGTRYFEIEELYVVPSHRSKGIGKALFHLAEEEMKKSGIEYIMLSTATKRYKSILHFYIDELEMDFWSARLFKKYDIV